MPARVVVVHDDPEFVDALAAALDLAGHQVAAFPNPLVAWDALAAAQLTEVLITGLQFPVGESNGLALARMARANRRGIQVVLIAMPEFAKECEGDGVFLPVPVSVRDVAKTVELLLQGAGDSPSLSHGPTIAVEAIVRPFGISE